MFHPLLQGSRYALLCSDLCDSGTEFIGAYREVEFWFENRGIEAILYFIRSGLYTNVYGGVLFVLTVMFLSYWGLCFCRTQNLTAREWKKENILYSIRTV